MASTCVLSKAIGLQGKRAWLVAGEGCGSVLTCPLHPSHRALHFETELQSAIA